MSYSSSLRRPAAHLYTALGLCGSLALIAAPPARAHKFVVASSTFDSGADGWTIDGPATGPQFSSGGGNPGGYIFADEPGNSNDTSYWRAPAKFRGDISVAYKQKLSFDLRVSGAGALFSAVDVVLVGQNGVTLVYSMKQPPKKDKWKRFTVKLDGKGQWRVNNTANKPSSFQMLEVLNIVSALLIRGEFIDGPDTFSLDNVVLKGFD